MRTPNSVLQLLLQEKLVLANYDEYANKVAEAYAASPVLDPKAVPHWAALMASTENTLYPKIEAALKKKAPGNPKAGIHVVDYHPYQTAQEMAKEIDTGIYRVSSADSEHPLWTVEQNVKFRAVHDWFTHYINKADFSLRGELRAYNAYVKLLPRDAVPAAFTEIVGQACSVISNGSFAEQKICLLDGFDYHKVGVIKGESEPSAEK